MVFQQGRRESGDRDVRFSPAHPELPRQLLHRWVRRRETDDREHRWEPFSTSYLFDRDAFGQVPRLIHIRAAEHCNMIRQELQWNRK